MATIRDRDSKYQAVIRRKGHPEIVKTFVLKKDAEKWARQHESLMDSELWVGRSIRHAIHAKLVPNFSGPARRKDLAQVEDKPYRMRSMPNG